MALGFSAMTRVFESGSQSKITRRLAELFANVDRIANAHDYERAHSAFCDWFVQTIRTAERELKNGRTKPCDACSYGQAAKVLDVAAKVYFYYCAQPSVDASARIVPLLHGGVDNQIMRHLIRRFPETAIRAKTIHQVNREEYAKLQTLIAKDIETEFQSHVYPVQYDDIMWRRLNREVAVVR
jgi:hypothetical protein